MTRGIPGSRRSLSILSWVILLGVMLGGGYHRHYVAQWQVLLLYPAFFLLALVLFVDLMTTKIGKAHLGPLPSISRSSWPEALIHLAPLFIFIALGPTSIVTLRPDLNRSIKSASSERNAPDTNPRIGQAPEGWPRLTILDLYSEIPDEDSPNREEEEIGRPAEVEGRIHVLSEEEKGRIKATLGVTKVQMILYRHILTCCAADAQPLAMILEGRIPSDFVNDSWGRVRGTVRIVTADVRLLAITAQDIRQIPEPDNPYLSLR